MLSYKGGQMRASTAARGINNQVRRTNPPGGPPDKIHFLLWQKEREAWYYCREVERLQRELNFLKWATRDLLDVLEDHRFMDGLERKGFFARKIARLKGVV